MPNDYEEDVPKLARKCWREAREAFPEVREASEESLGFWVGNDLQWRETERASRLGNNRPYTSVNLCKPAVEQVENEARNSPPGPECHPSGDGADGDGSDIVEGLIREYTMRSDPDLESAILALRYGLAGGAGCWELATDYRSEYTSEQCLVLKPIVDPAMVACDPNARLRHRQDAMWQIHVQRLSAEQLREQYPDAKLRVLEPSFGDRTEGWMREVFEGDYTFSEWMGEKKKGPYYVAQFWRVKIEIENRTLYDDSIERFESEPIPQGVKPRINPDTKKPYTVKIPRRKVYKHVVTALDELVEPIEWAGDIIPIFWILGPEIWIKGKLYRLTFLSGGIGPQRSLNYVATSANEIVGQMTKSPFLGWEGQFDVTNAQGFNPWESASTQAWAYMEVKPVWAIDPTGEKTELLPSPQRNQWEAPIGRLFELLAFWTEKFKSTTAVYFEPGAQSARDVQSGEAIKELQAQTNIGSAGWQSALRSAKSLEYNQAIKVMQSLYDGPTVKSIIKADSEHEIVAINQSFPAGAIDPKTGRKLKNNSILGRFSLTCTAGATDRRKSENVINNLLGLLKEVPQILATPGVAAMVIRVLGEGQPQIEQIADALDPVKPGEEQTPAQLQGQLSQAQQKIQALTLVLQKAQQAITAKLPDLELRKFETILNNLTKLRVAEISASLDADNADANRVADQLQQLLGMAHERGMQHVEHAQQTQQAQIAAETAGQQQDEQESQS